MKNRKNKHALELEIEKKLAEMINPFGQTFSIKQISTEIIKIISHDENVFFIPPTFDDVYNYILNSSSCMNITTSAAAEKISKGFVSYYEKVGWKVGKSKKTMVNWKKAVTDWCNRPWNNLDDSKSKASEAVKAHILHEAQMKNFR